MITSGLPSDDDLRAMWHTHLFWVLWIYPTNGGRTIRVWNRTLDRPPLDRRYQPVGCITIE